MLTITVHVTGLDQAKERLSRLGESLYDFRGAFETLSTLLIAFFSETVFVSQGSALGRPWAGLKEATIREKTKKWPGRGILQRSGEMQGSFYGTPTAHSLFIGNRSDHFIYHQLGTKKMPQRRMIGVNPAVVGMIKQVIEADIREKIAASEV